MPLKLWYEENKHRAKVSWNGLKERVYRCGYEPEDALTLPHYHNYIDRPGILYEYQGKMMKVSHISRLTGIHRATLNSRLLAGMTADEAVAKPVMKKKAPTNRGR